MNDNENQPIKVELANSIEDGIAVRIRAARESNGMSQSELHNKTGLSRTVLINYEAGRHKPSARELKLLCDALEVSPNYLIYGTEETHSKSDSFTDLILSLKGESAVIATTLIPTIASVLGTDDIRSIINLVESLIKAKSPKEYELIKRLLLAAKNNSGKKVDEINWLVDGDLLVEAIKKSIDIVFKQNKKS